MTGLGEKHREASVDINVTTHIADIISLMQSNNISDVIIVGFSYGGMVATGVANKMYERIRFVIYLDAFFPLSGQSLFDIFGDKITKSLQALTESFGNGWLLPFFDTYDTRLTDQPVGTGKERIHYRTDLFDSVPAVYVECIEKPSSWTFTPVLKAIADCRREAGWDVRSFASDHFPMHSKPRQLAALIHELCTSV